MEKRNLITKSSIGVILGGISGASFAFGSLMIVKLSTFSAISIAWYVHVSRFLIFSLWYLAERYFRSEANSDRISMKDVAVLVIHGLLHSPFMICVAISYKYIPFADATSILLSAPGLIAFLDRFINGSPCGIIETMVSIFSTVGVLLIIQPEFIFGNNIAEHNADKMKGNIFAILALVSTSAYYANSKRVMKYNFNLVILIVSVVGLIIYSVCLLAMDVFNVPQTSGELLLLLGICVTYTVVNILLTKSLQISTPLATKIGRMLDIPASYIIQCLYQHQYPFVLSIVGVVFIFTSSIILSCKKEMETANDDQNGYSRIQRDEEEPDETKH